MSIWNTRGVHLPLYKEPAASRPIDEINSVTQVILPLSYGDAKACHSTLKIYETVLRGAIIGQSDNKQSTPSIATVTGVFSETRVIQHPVFGELNCAVIDCMTSFTERQEKANKTDSLSAKEIIAASRRANILDELDGVPLHLKLQEWLDSGCDLLVANGVEAEPYSSSAWVVLNGYAEQIQMGLRLAARAIGASGSHIAVRLPAQRLRPLRQRLGNDQVFQVKRRYPVDQYAPAPHDASISLIGVQACLALYRATAFGEGHCSGVLTVAGDAVANPKNVRVPFGVSVEAVLNYCGLSADPTYVILGDAMTGVTTPSLNVPILPGITCILALTSRPAPRSQPCIGCGRCAQVCHAGLLPYEIVRRLENMHYERLPSLFPTACDGCGACSHVCPSGREVCAHVMEAQQTPGSIFLNWGDDDDA